MKKFLVLFLVAVMLVGCFAGCNGAKGNDTQTTKKANDDGNVPLPVADYSDRTYTVLYRDLPDYRAEWVAEGEETGQVIGAAVYSRNAAVEERYGVYLDFETGRAPAQAVAGDFENNFQAKIDKTVAAGDDVYQLAAGYTYRLATISTQGNFLNWYSMPNINLDEDWWSTDFFTYATYKGCCYIGAGPLSLTHMKASACIFFNINQLDEYVQDGTATVFQQVRDGTWTIDKLMTYAKDCTPEIVGSDEQKYGFSCDQNQCTDAFIYAFDLKITTYDSEGTPKIKSINASNPLVDVYDKLKTFIGSESYYSVKVGEDPDTYLDGMVGMFKLGRTVFAAGILDRASGIRTDYPEIEYGILPYPKWNEDQSKYYTYKTDSHTSFAIPKSVRDKEFVGTITEAMAYYSNKYVKDALYNVVLKYRDATDAESSHCVDLILDGGRFDFANIYAGAWGDQQGPAHLFRQCLKDENKPSIVKAFSAEKSRYDASLTDLLNNFKIEE